MGAVIVRDSIYSKLGGGGGWKCMMIGFVENYTSWKRIKSPIDQHTVCQFSSIIKATVLRTNIEQSSYHPNALHWSCILIKLLHQCTIFPFQILYIDILNTADHDWVASFVDVLYIAQRHFKLPETRNARYIRHNPNVIYLNKLWMGLAKPGMALFRDSN